MSADLYEALGIDRTAGPDEIKRAYRKAAKKAHPDGGGSAEEFSMVSLAHDVLRDGKRRQRYDETGKYEEVGPDNRESKIMSIVMNTVVAVLNGLESSGRQIEMEDVVEHCVDCLNQEIVKMLEAQRNAKISAEKVRAVAKRFKSKRGKPNVLRPMMEARAGEFDRAANDAVQFLDQTREAIGILKGHSFEREVMQQFGAFTFQTFSTASSGTR